MKLPHLEFTHGQLSLSTISSLKRSTFLINERQCKQSEFHDMRLHCPTIGTRYHLYGASVDGDEHSKTLTKEAKIETKPRILFIGKQPQSQLSEDRNRRNIIITADQDLRLNYEPIAVSKSESPRLNSHRPRNMCVVLMPSRLQPRLSSLNLIRIIAWRL